MSDIFEEVEEEVRKDRLTEIWGRFGWIVWVLAILIVGGVAIGELMNARNLEAAETRMTQLEGALVAMDRGEYDQAEADLSEIASEGVALSPMTAHVLAQLKLDTTGDLEAAGDTLANVAGNDSGAFEQLALLKSVYLRSDALTLSETEQELAPLVAKETPLGALAQEMIAAKAFAEGDYERARRDFNRLRFAANAPPGLIQRATIALDAIPRAEPAIDEQTQDGDDVSETEETR